MWKIKYPVFKKILNKNLTHSEVILLLYLGLHQDESGWARGIYFKDIKVETGMSVQSYYNAWRGLESKGVINTKKTHSKDRDFHILENDLRAKNFKEGYYDLSQKIFSDPEFSELKANEILLAMEMLKNNMTGERAFVIGTKTFFEKYMKLFNVNERTLRDYLQSLKKFFHIKFKNGKYSFLAKFNKVYKRYTPGEISEEQSYRKDIVKTGCHRAKIKEYSEKDFSDTTQLLIQYKNYGSAELLAECLIKAIEKSLKIVNENEKIKSNWRYILNCKLIHTVFRAELGIK